MPPETDRRAVRRDPPQGQGPPASQPAALLGEDNKHVSADLRKAVSGAALSPILMLRGDDTHPLIIADGYHRVCASYWIDENTDIPCILV